MSKLQRANDKIRNLFKSGGSLNEDEGKESSIQASISVNTEPLSQVDIEAESSKNLASREKSFADE
jgi:hypothetical protein